jgi:hypothetical protein
MADPLAEITTGLSTLQLSDDLFPNFAGVANTLVHTPTKLRDSLMIQRLLLIDRFTTLRTQIDSGFKDGFIDVSRASYAGTSLNRPYGRDYWDGRVQATTKVHVKNGVVELQEDEVEEEILEEKEGLDKAKGVRNRKTKDNESKGESNEKKKKKKKKYNPIDMFGVLVPYQLRQAQKSFEKSVHALIELSNVVRELDEINAKIMQVQKQVDIERDIKRDIE